MKREDSDRIVGILEEKYPEAECALKYEGDPWKLLMMSILSAQCTDKRVNLVSKKLFEEYPDANKMAKAAPEEVEPLIKECGLYRAKAVSLVESSKRIVSEYGGEIPSEMEKLLTLRGVGRKIANLIIGDIYKKPAIVADTHCIRLSSRLGYTKRGEKDPLRTEKTLKKIIPEEKQADFCHRLVLFGREVCDARKPNCEKCPIGLYCRYNSDLQGEKNGKRNQHR